MTNIEPFIRKVLRTLEACRVDGPESGFRQKCQDPPVADLYGTADAAVLMYTLGELPSRGTASHAAMVQALRGYQEEVSGLFPGAGHHPIHGTAYAAAALELLDARPLHPVAALRYLKERDELHRFLDGLDWRNSPWGESHKGAGLYAAMVLTGEADAEWEDLYFDWLWQEADPVTGLWRQGAIAGIGEVAVVDAEANAGECEGAVVIEGAAANRGAPLFHHLAGSFHYLFNLDYRKRPLRYPERWADTCMKLFESGAISRTVDNISFAELDVLYTLVSVMRQTRYRADELESAAREIGTSLLCFVADCTEEMGDRPFADLHPLTGTVCALAIVQSLMPEQVQSDLVLRKVLDRRPFI